MNRDHRLARSQSRFHQWTATCRGVEFKISFEEWWGIWQASGHWHERGRGRDKYCMSRSGDSGPYAVGNVRIITNAENLAEYEPTAEIRAKLSRAGRNRSVSEETRAKIGFANRNRSPEILAKIGLASRSRSPEMRAKFAARMRSPEVRAKISLAAKAWRAKKRAAAEGALA